LIRHVSVTLDCAAQLVSPPGKAFAPHHLPEAFFAPFGKSSSVPKISIDENNGAVLGKDYVGAPNQPPVLYPISKSKTPKCLA
jgi:hypothetical protein